MKIHPFFSFALVVLVLGFAGCTSTGSNTKTPPASSAATDSKETPAPTPTPPAADSTEPSAATPAPQPAADEGSNQTIPIDKLPKKSGYPYGIKTKWPGLVKSPYAQDKTLVDVGAMASGTPVRCPHTGKIFIVP